MVIVIKKNNIKLVFDIIRLFTSKKNFLLKMISMIMVDNKEIFNIIIKYVKKLIKI